MKAFTAAIAAASAISAVTADDFNILQHVGGNGQWFPGPEVTGISSEVPAGCKVELAAFFSRHGSRYPDNGAYNEWKDLYSRIEAASNLTITEESLKFLKTWKPVLSDPSNQIGQISTTGYKELASMGSNWRLRYPDLYDYNTPFTMWANYYKSGPRVRDSARMFTHGFLGPNATDLGTIYALNSSDPRSWGNSLATSDLCEAYNDEGGSPYKDVWDSIYLPPIRARLNAGIRGDFNLTQWDVSIIPYLCGFETQITGRRSAFCDVFTEEEALQYEYAQDLRYWYGNGLGSDIEKYIMLPVIDGLVQRFVDGPNATYQTGNGTFVPPKIIASFSNDGQINQLIAGIGVFDNEPQLPANRMLRNRKFRASRLVPMRGTVAFERLSCPAASTGYSTGNSTSDAYMRIRLNEVTYPVVNCSSGPGSSCPLSQYQSIIKSKIVAVGDFTKVCNTTDSTFTAKPFATFFKDNTLSYQSIVKP
ncbi:acid phosphatase PHO12 precursor [Didymella exigua CBS 183.55]|uniref:Acid phosphatase PHO12 n=1 Tax=Didymella exigua CBS 183.55 TaxID=1150837 RepID=A0A6A5RLN9_9PLEO|nr:acid phosphatase PHO12 precursor [Didymella exigua CBS 183.55]KAF1927276.1 acid phosphatase PHO12 precursor [Didymella exigua CBS 183.55]